MKTDKCDCGAPKDPRAKHCFPCSAPLRNRARRNRKPDRLSTNGYVLTMVDGQERYKHRVVMGQKLGRPIRGDEHVHHVNGDKTDNRPENLELLSHSEHSREHMTFHKAKEMSILGHAARWGFGG